MTGMNFGIVIPYGGGRKDNLIRVLDGIHLQTRDTTFVPVVIVAHGQAADGESSMIFNESNAGRWKMDITWAFLDKNPPPSMPPRNYGADLLTRDRFDLDIDFIWFLDTDVVPEVQALDEYIHAIELHDGNGMERDYVLAGQYDWRAQFGGIQQHELREAMFRDHPFTEILYYNLAAALGNFSGNLVWPAKKFLEVGGFHPELTAGRCDDGELGLRAARDGIGTCFVAGAVAHHWWHPVNSRWVLETNARDVPIIDRLHPWVRRVGLVPRPEDGQRFNWRCPWCGDEMNSNLSWEHMRFHGEPTIPSA